METVEVAFWDHIRIVMNELAESFDHQWRERRRKIGTSFLVEFLIRLGFSKAQSGFQIVINEMWKNMRANGSPLPQVKPFAASSVCEARQNLDPSYINEMNSQVVQSFLLMNEHRFTWHGRRLFAVDGSNINLPPELKNEGFDIMSDTHYPQGKMSVLLHVPTCIPVDVILDNKGNEREIALQHTRSLTKGDVVVYDRGYFSYEIAEAHLENGIDLICRLPIAGNNVAIQRFIDDHTKPFHEIVIVTPSKSVKRKLEKKGARSKSRSITLRLIRYFIGKTEYILCTTILDETITSEEFAEVYHGRWGIEEHYKTVKSMLTLEVFHSKTLRGVLQEIYAKELVVTLSRVLATDTETLMGTGLDEEKKRKQIARLSGSHVPPGDATQPCIANKAETKKTDEEEKKPVVLGTEPTKRVDQCIKQGDDVMNIASPLLTTDIPDQISTGIPDTNRTEYGDLEKTNRSKNAGDETTRHTLKANMKGIVIAVVDVVIHAIFSSSRSLALALKDAFIDSIRTMYKKREGRSFKRCRKRPMPNKFFIK